MAIQVNQFCYLIEFINVLVCTLFKLFLSFLFVYNVYAITIYLSLTEAVTNISYAYILCNPDTVVDVKNNPYIYCFHSPL